MQRIPNNPPADDGGGGAAPTHLGIGDLTTSVDAISDFFATLFVVARGIGQDDEGAIADPTAAGSASEIQRDPFSHPDMGVQSTKETRMKRFGDQFVIPVPFADRVPQPVSPDATETMTPEMTDASLVSTTTCCVCLATDIKMNNVLTCQHCSIQTCKDCILAWVTSAASASDTISPFFPKGVLRCHSNECILGSSSGSGAYRMADWISKGCFSLSEQRTIAQGASNYLRNECRQRETRSVTSDGVLARCYLLRRRCITQLRMASITVKYNKIQSHWHSQIQGYTTTPKISVLCPPHAVSTTEEEEWWTQQWDLYRRSPTTVVTAAYLLQKIQQALQTWIIQQNKPPTHHSSATILYLAALLHAIAKAARIHRTVPAPIYVVTTLDAPPTERTIHPPPVFQLQVSDLATYICLRSETTEVDCTLLRKLFIHLPREWWVWTPPAGTATFSESLNAGCIAKEVLPTLPSWDLARILLLASVTGAIFAPEQAVTHQLFVLPLLHNTPNQPLGSGALRFCIQYPECRGRMYPNRVNASSTATEASFQLLCQLCNTAICGECHTPFDDTTGTLVHQCRSEERESIATISKSTKPCPQCLSPITRIDGCRHMFCPQCSQAYDWETSELQVSNTNPEFHRWNNQRAGAATEIHPNRRFNVQVRGEDGMTMIERVTALQELALDVGCRVIPGICDQIILFYSSRVQELIQYIPTPSQFENLRLAYLMGDITQEQWHTLLDRAAVRSWVCQRYVLRLDQYYQDLLETVVKPNIQTITGGARFPAFGDSMRVWRQIMEYWALVDSVRMALLVSSECDLIGLHCPRDGDADPPRTLLVHARRFARSALQSDPHLPRLPSLDEVHTLTPELQRLAAHYTTNTTATTMCGADRFWRTDASDRKRTNYILSLGQLTF